MVKTLQKSSLEPLSQLPFYLVCSIGPIIVGANDDSGFILTHFKPRSNLVTYAFVWKKVEMVIFSKPIVPCKLKVGICSQLNE